MCSARVVSLSSGSRGGRGGHGPPWPCENSHKKDGRRRRPHRFHVSRPPPLPGCWIRYCLSLRNLQEHDTNTDHCQAGNSINMQQWRIEDFFGKEKGCQHQIGEGKGAGGFVGENFPAVSISPLRDFDFFAEPFCCIQGKRPTVPISLCVS